MSDPVALSVYVVPELEMPAPELMGLQQQNGLIGNIRFDILHRTEELFTFPLCDTFCYMEIALSKGFIYVDII